MPSYDGRGRIVSKLKIPISPQHLDKLYRVLLSFDIFYYLFYLYSVGGHRWFIPLIYRLCVQERVMLDNLLGNFSYSQHHRWWWRRGLHCPHKVCCVLLLVVSATESDSLRLPLCYLFTCCNHGYWRRRMVWNFPFAVIDFIITATQYGLQKGHWANILSTGMKAASPEPNNKSVSLLRLCGVGDT